MLQQKNKKTRKKTPEKLAKKKKQKRKKNRKEKQNKNIKNIARIKLFFPVSYFYFLDWIKYKISVCQNKEHFIISW